ncbi:3-mercaptopyruvate sulfurtransferase [Triplophysa tibetana]|uniref:Sulfurtransferase n=1 Tax=Triplophysa tibetana TaxID=1572043 RepID=A0A5A9NAB0_9TELE|nr:3-mercaptopyruvate sulfurtransferase [Triplophysa tibetana]
MAAAQTRALVAARWLADAVKSNRVGPNLRILDASWYLSKLNRSAKDEFKQTHIPGASLFDIDECCDKSSEFDHMLPSKGEFADYVGNLGIGNNTHVVVYDASDFGSFSAPRVWWMFKVFGHNSVSVLDGGFKSWLREGHPVTDQYTKPQRTEFKATFNGSWVKTYKDVLENTKTKTVQVVDARANGRFRGVEPEPRANIEPGHIPGSINMPFASFMDKTTGMELPVEELSKLFLQAGVDMQKPFWVTCGSGVTACHIALAAHLCGHLGVCLYDGAWNEWFTKAAPEHVMSEGKGKQP